MNKTKQTCVVVTKTKTATKSVWQCHDQKDEFTEYFNDFRHVTNESIRLGLELGLTSRKSFHDSLYKKMESGLYASVKQNGIYVATALLKTMRTNQRKGRKVGIPYVRKDTLKFNNQACGIIDGFAEMCVAPKVKIKIRLAPYMLEAIGDSKVGGMTVTPHKLIISYSKKVETAEPSGHVGIDMNFDNVTTCDDQGNITKHDISRVGKVKQRCRETVSHFKRNDRRIRKKIAGKYGKKSRNVSQDVLHKISSSIANSGLVPAIEDLEEISKKWDKKNKRGRNANFRGKNWSHYELARQLTYKSLWNGNVLKKVNPWGTSSKCAACGGKMITEERRMMRCPNGNITVDRDENASINILARGLKVRPVGSAGEAMVRCSHGRISLVVEPSVDANQLFSSG